MLANIQNTNNTLNKIREMQEIRRQRTNNIIQQQQIKPSIQPQKPIQPMQQQIIQKPDNQLNKLNTPYFSTAFQQNKLNNNRNNLMNSQINSNNISQDILTNQNNTTQDMLQRLRNMNQQSQSLNFNQTNNSDKSAILTEGSKYIGTKYVWGGNDLSKGVDCSGLTQQLFSKQGIKLPRTAAEQSKGGKSVKLGELQAGDLVFFNTIEGNNKEVDHVGIYQGNGQMLHASSSKGVKIEDFTKAYWQSRLVKAKRY